jgi:predicted small secreted protein
MFRVIVRLLLIGMLSAVALGGCNTVTGIGKDIGSVL